MQESSSYPPPRATFFLPHKITSSKYLFSNSGFLDPMLFNYIWPFLNFLLSNMNIGSFFLLKALPLSKVSSLSSHHPLEQGKDKCLSFPPRLSPSPLCLPTLRPLLSHVSFPSLSSFQTTLQAHESRGPGSYCYWHFLCFLQVTLPKVTMETWGRGEPAGLRENLKGQESAKYNLETGSFRRSRQTNWEELGVRILRKQKMSLEGNIQINFPRGLSSLRPGPGLSLHLTFPLLSHSKYFCLLRAIGFPAPISSKASGPLQPLHPRNPFRFCPCHTYSLTYSD